MSTPIADYALIGDMRTAALVDRRGSIDWLCLPAFDSDACFAALLGEPAHGRWLLGPREPHAVERSYRPGTLTLVTRYTTATGVAEVIEFMPTVDGRRDVVRRIRGVKGRVRFDHEWIVRFGYGRRRPWVHRVPDHSDLGCDEMLVAVAGADAIGMRGPVLPTAHGDTHSGVFEVRAGDQMTFTLSWWPSHRQAPPPLDVTQALFATEREFRAWSHRSTYAGPHADAVAGSLAVLRALTDSETGGIVAAPTTSLPEQIGGSRNWDYRYCWLRDASLTLTAFLEAGYRHETRVWRDWLLRAIAGSPADMHIMYGIDGRLELPEHPLDHLPGYEGSRPVRVGNGAALQQQRDVLGEVMIALHEARRRGVADTPDAWALQVALVDHLEETWDKPDQGIWEIRGPARHFTHSEAMSWAALDRAVEAVESTAGTTHPLEGPVEKWRQTRDRVREAVLTRGVAKAGHFTQHDETDEVDASLLLAPIGFVAPDDPRYVATVERIERDLVRDGFVYRYRTASGVDGLTGSENPFLACSFWLLRAYALMGRTDDATTLMERLLALSNDLGLLPEEYDPENRRFVGNYPQAFSHLALVEAAFALHPSTV